MDGQEVYLTAAVTKVALPCGEHLRDHAFYYYDFTSDDGVAHYRSEPKANEAAQP